MDSKFPILSTQWQRHVTPAIISRMPKEVPWEWVQDHQNQAQKNHYQTLERLAERGGLSPSELYCVMNDKPFDKRGVFTISEQEACLWIINKVIG